MTMEHIQRRIERLSDQVEEAPDQEDWEAVRERLGDPRGPILVSSPLEALVESSGQFEFGDAQDVELKALAGSHQVFDVKWTRRLSENSIRYHTRFDRLSTGW